jgi:NAD(P)-dependent dehydrogenase (short-subunit alcohol dehydrogenase family)
MSGLATVGWNCGGGAVAGVGVLAAAPALITTAAMSQVFKEDESLPAQENEARRVGQPVTTATAVAGTVEPLEQLLLPEVLLV